MLKDKLFQPQFNDKKGQCGKGGKPNDKDTLFDMHPCAGYAAAGPCAAAVVSAMRARPDADWYVVYDPHGEGRAMCIILVQGRGSLSGFAESISAHAVGKDYAVPEYAMGFFAFNGKFLAKAMQSCCTIPIPGISAASCGEAARESLASALYIELLRARVFIPFQQLL
jgi:hypothetical protein